MRRFETHMTVTKVRSSPAARNLQIMSAPLRTLKPSQSNARTHLKRQIKQIAGSIIAFGWTYPILIDEDKNIIAGNGRYLAACELGLTEVPVMTLNGLTQAQKRSLAIADNKIAANAGWDRSVLAAELGELATLLPEIDLDISITGFEPAEIDALAIDFTDPEREPLDEVPIVDSSKPVTAAGDLWQLGNHRLHCGDACDESALQKLMGSDRSSMVFADGPYNVRIANTVGRGRIKHREFAVASGEMSPAQFTDFVRRWMTLATRYSKPGSIHFSCIDWRHVGEMLAAGKDVYSTTLNIIVWVKTAPAQGSFYRSQHEFIAVFRHGNTPHQNNIELGKYGRSRSNVWTYAGVNSFCAGRMDELRLHPTVKPVALVADAMRDCSRRGDIVLDPFMGSGTTILAAERIGRRAFGLEIDPLYVDVAVRRWQSFTGRDAVLEATGQTFNEVMDQGRIHKRKRRRSK